MKKLFILITLFISNFTLAIDNYICKEQTIDLQRFDLKNMSEGINQGRKFPIDTIQLKIDEKERIIHSINYSHGNKFETKYKLHYSDKNEYGDISHFYGISMNAYDRCGIEYDYKRKDDEFAKQHKMKPNPNLISDECRPSKKQPGIVFKNIIFNKTNKVFVETTIFEGYEQHGTFLDGKNEEFVSTSVAYGNCRIE